MAERRAVFDIVGRGHAEPFGAVAANQYGVHHVHATADRRPAWHLSIEWRRPAHQSEVYRPGWPWRPERRPDLCPFGSRRLLQSGAGAGGEFAPHRVKWPGVF